MITHI